MSQVIAIVNQKGGVAKTMSVRTVECGAEGKSIFKHDPKGKVADAYANLAMEVIENAEREQRRAHKHQAVR